MPQNKKITELIAGTPTTTDEIVYVDLVSGETKKTTVGDINDLVVRNADDIDDTSTTNKFVTSSDVTNLSNLSGTNTGDETTSTIKTKLSITTLSGSNTGDQDLSGKQDVLVSGTNIKTINGTSVLGSGDIAISGGTSPFSTTSNITSNSPGTISTDDFIFGSDTLEDDGNTTKDSKMFFDKSKYAFRAGGVTGTHWDDVNRGVGSAAFGQNTVASEPYSFASGFNVVASGYGSTASGFDTVASGPYSFASGFSAVASGQSSLVIGNSSRAESDNSVAIGTGVTSSAIHAMSIGNMFGNNKKNSFAVGFGDFTGDIGGVKVRLESDSDQDETKKGAIYLAQTTAPISTIDRMYNVSGKLNWNGGEVVDTSSTTSTAPAGASTYINVIIGGVAYRILAKAVS